MWKILHDALKNVNGKITYRHLFTTRNNCDSGSQNCEMLIRQLAYQPDFKMSGLYKTRTGRWPAWLPSHREPSKA